MQGGHNNCSF